MVIKTNPHGSEVEKDSKNADLYVSSLDFQEGGFHYIIIGITNRGNAAAGPFHVMITVDGMEKKVMAIGELKLHHTLNIHYAPNWKCNDACNIIKVTADCYNEINECNNSNTSMEKTFKHKK